MIKIGITEIDDWYCEGYTGDECWVVYTESGRNRNLKAKKINLVAAVAFAQNLFDELKKNGEDVCWFGVNGFGDIVENR